MLTQFVMIKVMSEIPLLLCPLMNHNPQCRLAEIPIQALRHDLRDDFNCACIVVLGYEGDQSINNPTHPVCQ